MSLDVAFYQAKVYGVPQPCWLLVADIYTNVLGQAVDEYKTVTTSVREAARLFRLHVYKGKHGFSQVAEPVDYAVVFLGKSHGIGIHHCGIYYQGKVLHAEEGGTLHQDLASLGDAYKLMEFWAR